MLKLECVKVDRKPSVYDAQCFRKFEGLDSIKDRYRNNQNSKKHAPRLHS